MTWKTSGINIQNLDPDKEYCIHIAYPDWQRDIDLLRGFVWAKQVKIAAAQITAGNFIREMELLG